MGRNREKTAIAAMTRSVISQATTSGTNIVVGYDTAATDPFGLCDTVNHTITIPTDGLYYIHASVHYNGETSPVAGTYRYMYFERDSGGGFGTDLSTSVVRANSAAQSDSILSTGYIAQYSAGDVLRVITANNSGESGVSPFGNANGPFIFASAHTRFEICQEYGRVIA